MEDRRPHDQHRDSRADLLNLRRGARVAERGTRAGTDKKLRSAIRAERRMRILLFSMPDSFEHTPALTMRMPNGALASLAGNIGPRHRAGIGDLILVQDRVAATVERLMRDFAPDVVGLSIMTFQRRTALRLVRLLRRLQPTIKIVAGGYDPSLAPEAYEDPAWGI